MLMVGFVNIDIQEKIKYVSNEGYSTKTEGFMTKTGIIRFFQTTIPPINIHVNNILAKGELS